jgi:hypothetical protein
MNYTSNFNEACARLESDRNRQAELNAQTRRLDKDRIIFAGLQLLAHSAKTRGLLYPGTFIAGASGIETRHTPETGNAYVLELLAEIHAQLSPLVK